MKKLLLAIAIVATGFTANAQDVQFGAKAGLNIASLNGGGKNFDVDSRTSFHVGAMVEISLSDKFSVQPELLYSNQGATRSEEDLDVTFKMDYLTVPVMAKYYVAEGLSLEAGPQLAFNLNAESVAKFKGEEETRDLSEETEGFDFGLNFGLGYKLDNGLNFGARYNLGLSGIAKEKNEDVDAVKNGVFQVSVGYFF